uniref:DUF4140 domain-containing protein n=1 Tax=Plectus sambesii TaxID=2011161 RepID=A0A914UGU6_9BILA
MASPTDAIAQHVFNVKSLPTAHVTVYQDRAEVQRLIRVKCEAGKNEVLVRGITSNFDSSSVRVDGRGSATICDVQQRQRTLKDDDADYVLAKELEDEIVQLQSKLSELQDKSTILHKKLTVLSGVSDQVATGQKDASFPFSESSLDNLSTFLAFYDDNMALVQSQQRANDAETTKINDEIALLRRKIDELYDGGPREVSK